MSRGKGVRRVLVAVLLLLAVIVCFGVLKNEFLNNFMLLDGWGRKEVKVGKEGRA